MRRARVAFLLLLLVGVLAAGSLSAALAADPSPVTGLRVAASGLVLVVAVSLAARMLVVSDRARRQQRPQSAREPHPRRARRRP